MLPEPAAVLFDLDDTLYGYRRFVLSGFAAVARELAMSRGSSSSDVFRQLVTAMRHGARGRELQACAAALQLEAHDVSALVTCIRSHRPSLRLPRDTRSVLETLRRDWRLAIVTNGTPEIQARKIDVLGLRAFVDVVVYATEHGTGCGKPDPAPFCAALERLGVEASRAVFVGDDEACDVAGASRVGMRTVLIRRRGRHLGRTGLDRDAFGTRGHEQPDARVRHLTEVPRAARRLLEGRATAGAVGVKPECRERA